MPQGIIQPISASSYLDSQFNVDWHYKPSGLGLTEQLYTARGSQGGVLEESYAKLLMASPHYPESDTPTWLYAAFANNQNWAIPMRTLFTVKDAPVAAAIWVSPLYYWSLIQYPLYTFLVDTEMDSVN